MTDPFCIVFQIKENISSPSNWRETSKGNDLDSDTPKFGGVKLSGTDESDKCFLKRICDPDCSRFDTDP